MYDIPISQIERVFIPDIEINYYESRDIEINYYESRAIPLTRWQEIPRAHLIHQINFQGLEITKYYINDTDLYIQQYQIKEPMKVRLDTGMIVRLENNRLAKVMITREGDFIIFQDSGITLDLSDYTENLLHPSQGYSISKVYKLKHPKDVLNWKLSNYEEVWTRRKKITIAEIEEVLGFEIEIIDGD